MTCWLLEKMTAAIFWQPCTHGGSRNKHCVHSLLPLPHHGLQPRCQTTGSHNAGGHRSQGQTKETLEVEKLFISSEPHSNSCPKIQILHLFASKTASRLTPDAMFPTHKIQISLSWAPGASTCSYYREKQWFVKHDTFKAKTKWFSLGDSNTILFSHWNVPPNSNQMIPPSRSEDFPLT